MLEKLLEELNARLSLCTIGHYGTVNFDTVYFNRHLPMLLMLILHLLDSRDYTNDSYIIISMGCRKPIVTLST